MIKLRISTPEMGELVWEPPIPLQLKLLALPEEEVAEILAEWEPYIREFIFTFVAVIQSGPQTRVLGAELQLMLEDFKQRRCKQFLPAL